MMRVFFPDYAVSAKSGLCIGWVDHQTHTICVLAVVHLPVDPFEIRRQLKFIAAFCPLYLQMMTSIRHQPLTILGPLTYLRDPDRIKIQQLCQQVSQDLCLELTRPDLYSLPTCTLYKDGQALMQDHHFILYNQRKIYACCLPGRNDATDTPSNSETTTDQYSPTACGDSGCGTDQYGRTVLKIETVLSIIQGGVRQLWTLTDWDISSDVKRKSNKSSVIHWIVSFFVSVLVSMATVSLLPFRSDFCCRLSRSSVFQRVLRFTQTGCQIQAKYNHLQELLDAHSADGSDIHRVRRQGAEQTESQTRCEYLRTRNLWTYLLIDMLVGVLLMWWIQRNNWPDAWAEWIISSATTTAGSLQTLLQWLMGAPAGLKLNSALAHFLGQFFLYHVYLWIGYLSIIQPVLGWAIWCMSLTGCLGVSVILAVASDTVSMLTFHVYCFYVYAARIYRLQLTGLLALWRLFRGKKWNVLRKRIDTCNYDVDQLFIGTLLFTVLLFLLPTTMLFYAVFTMHRLAVIFLEGVLTKTIDLLKWLPVYSILLWLTGSDVLMSGVYFDLLQQPGEGCPRALVMQVQHMSLYDVLLLSYNSSKKSSTQPELSASRNPVISLALDLLTGCLIYPWSLAQNKT
ncbi:phosphatidylinositol N-acetylglucosaminyltransferase subunit Q-like [Patiria miniata]|uniref:Phosphatidylinositol N-acetylglucosaminyltransferase subunit Q n=1 Tax=Patiria miniata TaxID=46514 RepID=A0A914AYM8_PATMI|nr:phosphatidylinositol N-acetylglucosaminyltransferase subunit Q-like [Patiria miniata]